MTVCTYNTTNRLTITSMGNTYDDEMCDLYIMAYAPDEKNPQARRCSYEEHPQISRLLPKDLNQFRKEQD